MSSVGRSIEIFGWGKAVVGFRASNVRSSRSNWVNWRYDAFSCCCRSLRISSRSRATVSGSDRVGRSCSSVVSSAELESGFGSVGCSSRGGVGWAADGARGSIANGGPQVRPERFVNIKKKKQRGSCFERQRSKHF